MTEKRKHHFSESSACRSSYHTPGSTHSCPLPGWQPRGALLVEVHSSVNEAAASEVTCLGTDFWDEGQPSHKPSLEPSPFSLLAPLLSPIFSQAALSNGRPRIFNDPPSSTPTCLFIQTPSCLSKLLFFIVMAWWTTRKISDMGIILSHSVLSFCSLPVFIYEDLTSISF